MLRSHPEYAPELVKKRQELSEFPENSSASPMAARIGPRDLMKWLYSDCYT
jgi:hypothetical protein